MAQMKIWKVLKDPRGDGMTFLLLDEQRQYLLALQIWMQISSAVIQAAATRSTVPAEPLTHDFLANVLHALGGTLEEIAIGTRFGERLGIQFHLRDRQGLHMLNTSLKDGLLLAQREQSRISIREAILARRAVRLADYGATEAEQLAELLHRAEQDPDALRLPVQEALNLDFSDGPRGWVFFRESTLASYAFDPHTTLTGRRSLAITLHRPYTHGSSGILFYKAALPEGYRGQRIRLSAYVKIEQMHQPELQLGVSWPTDKISPVTGRAADASCLTYSHIVPHPGDSSWTRHEMIIHAPEHVQDFYITLGTQEQGKLWLDGIELAVVNHSVALTGTLLRPPPSEPLNLDFSEGLEYWKKESGALGHYEIAVDATPSPCATLKSIKEAPVGSCLLQQMLTSENYHGKSVRLTAYLKARDVAARGSFFIGSFPDMRDDRVEDFITGPTSWIQFTLEWRVPEEKQGLFLFGVSLQDPAQIWLKDVHLQTVSEA